LNCGSYILNFTAVNSLGKENSTAINVTLDKYPPKIIISSPNVSSIQGGQLWLNYTANDTENKIVNAKINFFIVFLFLRCNILFLFLR
jgi:hypothetical protein